MEISVSVRLDGWCHIYSRSEILSLKIKGTYIIPEAGLLKYRIYPDISVILTLIGGLIPSKMAAKKDPVIALRSE